MTITSWGAVGSALFHCNSQVARKVEIQSGVPGACDFRGLAWVWECGRERGTFPSILSPTLTHPGVP